MDDQPYQGTLADHKRLSAFVRKEMFEPEAARGNDNKLWSLLHTSIRNLSRRNKAGGLPTEIFEAQLHDTWYMYTLAAQNTDAEHPAQDRLLRIIQQADVGRFLCRSAVPGTTPSLPYLLEDVRAAWKALMEPLASYEQRCNLTGAIARLAGLSVCDGAFAACGLEIMKQALETPQLPTPDRTQERLALVRIWLRYAGDVTLQMCLARTSTEEETEWALGSEQVGPLARDAGVGVATPWSRERFLFWKDALASMRADIEDVESLEVKCATSIMLKWNVHFGIMRNS